MDFPADRHHKPVISTVSVESIGWNAQLFNISNVPTSGPWPSANLALFFPLVLAAPYNVKTLWWCNGASVAGNVDCGVYTLGGARLVSAGSTAQAGTSIVQSVVLGTPFLLMPGSYYMALATTSASSTFLITSVSQRYMQIFGAAQMATAAPLPAAATLASYAQTGLPIFGIARASVI